MYPSDFVRAFRKNCPDVRLEADEEEELWRLFNVCREEAKAEAELSVGRIKMLRRMTEEQALDQGLWFVAETCPEAYLQQELRKLHQAIES